MRIPKSYFRALTGWWHFIAFIYNTYVQIAFSHYFSNPNANIFSQLAVT